MPPSLPSSCETVMTRELLRARSEHTMLELEMNGAVGREAADGCAAPAGVADPELVERPARRRFAAEYKLRVLREADACSRPGEV